MYPETRHSGHISKNVRAETNIIDLRHHLSVRKGSWVL